MNTRILSAITLAITLSATASPVLAQGRPDTPGSQGQEHRSEIASGSQQFKQDLKTRLTAARQDRIKRWWKNAARRLQNLVNHEKAIATRIQSRITKLSTAGRDVTSLNTSLASANTAIAAAQKALDDATAQIDSIVANNSPKDAFAKLHDLTKSVIGKIRDAQRALIQVLVATKGLSETPTPTPTPSASPTPSPTTT